MFFMVPVCMVTHVVKGDSSWLPLTVHPLSVCMNSCTEDWKSHYLRRAATGKATPLYSCTDPSVWYFQKHGEYSLQPVIGGRLYYQPSRFRILCGKNSSPCHTEPDHAFCHTGSTKSFMHLWFCLWESGYQYLSKQSLSTGHVTSLEQHGKEEQYPLWTCRRKPSSPGSHHPHAP